MQVPPQIDRGEQCPACTWGHLGTSGDIWVAAVPPDGSHRLQVPTVLVAGGGSGAALTDGPHEAAGPWVTPPCWVPWKRGSCEKSPLPPGFPPPRGTTGGAKGPTPAGWVPSPGDKWVPVFFFPPFWVPSVGWGHFSGCTGPRNPSASLPVLSHLAPAVPRQCGAGVRLLLWHPRGRWQASRLVIVFFFLLLLLFLFNFLAVISVHGPPLPPFPLPCPLATFPWEERSRQRGEHQVFAGINTSPIGTAPSNTLKG